jgi:hypothetical protein
MVNQIVTIGQQQQQQIKLWHWQHGNNNNILNYGSGNKATTIVDKIIVMAARQQQ